MSEVSITGLTLRHDEPTADGSRLIAFFDAEVPFFRLQGCRLIRRATGMVAVLPPHIPGPQGQRRTVQITDTELKNDMRAAALRAYRLLGGELPHDAEDDDPE
jgi:hypothetical protein